MANDVYGMKYFPLTIGDTEYMIFSAQSPEERRMGLSELESIENDEGMFFTFPEQGVHQMWMKDTKFPLDILFLNDNVEILQISKGEPMDETLIEGPEETLHVLELPAGTVEGNLGVGDRIDGIPEEYRQSEDKPSDKPLKVVGEDGEVQFELEGGERIFSRKSTKKMVEAAQTANDDKGLIKLAKIALDEIIRQDQRQPEYTDEENVTYGKGEDGEITEKE